MFTFGECLQEAYSLKDMVPTCKESPRVSEGMGGGQSGQVAVAEAGVQWEGSSH